jgi:hypothetical protein
MLNVLTVWSVDGLESLPSRRVRLWVAKSLLVLLLLHPSFHRNMAIVFHCRYASAGISHCGVTIVLLYQVGFPLNLSSTSLFFASSNTQQSWRQRGHHHHRRRRRRHHPVGGSAHNRGDLPYDLVQLAQTASRNTERIQSDVLTPFPTRILNSKDASLDRPKVQLMPSAMLHTLTPTVRILITSIVAVQRPSPTSLQQLTCPLQTPHPRTPKKLTPSGSLKADRAAERATTFIRLPVAISSTMSEQESNTMAQDSQRPFVSQTLAETVTETVFLETSAMNAENRTPGQTKMVPHITPGLRLSGPSRRQALRNNPRWLPGLRQMLPKILR